ncbi:hypothetical protein niasHT_034794 [Heterodera trifolii]|uniref:Uncharacterized protein n=1 Tax=Heterodera trifolii TaxID=157864 RepID=A0ABD2IUF3_9BILA
MWVLGHHWITYQAGAQGHQLAYELVEPSWTTLPTFSVLWNSMVGMCQCSLGNHGPGNPFCYGGAPHRGTTKEPQWLRCLCVGRSWTNCAGPGVPWPVFRLSIEPKVGHPNLSPLPLL